jgi:hypothetical protein
VVDAVLLDPGGGRPADHGRGEGEAGDPARVAPAVGHGEGHEGIGAEEGEGEDTAHGDRRGQARRCPSGAGRDETEERPGRDREAGDDEDGGQERRPGGEAAHDEPGAESEDHGVAWAGVGRRVGLALGTVGGPGQRRQGHHAGDGDEREDGEEDGAPRQRLLDGRGGGRPDEPGDDPGGREHGEDAGTQRRRVAATDARIGDRRDGTGAEALHDAGGDEHRHGGRGASDGEADGEEAQTGDERGRCAPTVGGPPGEHRADHRAEEEPREDPAVELDAAEVVGDDRHHRRDGE